MPIFHHHPDGHIFISGSGRPYRATLAEFATDCQALGLPEYPGLPDGWTERSFDGERDILGRPEHRDDNPEPLMMLTAYLGAFDRLVAADVARDEGKVAARAQQEADMRKADDEANAAMMKQAKEQMAVAKKAQDEANAKMRALASAASKTAADTFMAASANADAIAATPSAVEATEEVKARTKRR